MQVFKLFSKIVPRKFLGVFIIYVLIFVGLMTFFSYSGFTQSNDAFELSKLKVSVINNDKTPLANHFESYIKGISTPVEIDLDENSIKDALFFRNTEFIITIPKGFEQKFVLTNSHLIETMSVPDSTNSEYARIIIDSYLRTAKLYLLANPEIPINQLNEKVVADISSETRVSLLNIVAAKDTSSVNTYFNFLSYILIAMLISMVGRIMLIFNNKDIKRRNYCSPISSKSYNLQLILSNFIIAIILWVILASLAFVINSNTISNTGSFLYLINSFVLTILCLSISFLVATFATKNSIDPIGNCFSLGLSFLGGSFVPQALLSDQLKTIGAFNPIFWYVKVNDTIGSLISLNRASLEPIVFGMIVQLAFALAFLSIALVIIKHKRISN